MLLLLLNTYIFGRPDKPTEIHFSSKQREIDINIYSKQRSITFTLR